MPAVSRNSLPEAYAAHSVRNRKSSPNGCSRWGWSILWPATDMEYARGGHSCAVPTNASNPSLIDKQPMTFAAAIRPASPAATTCGLAVAPRFSHADEKVGGQGAHLSDATAGPANHALCHGRCHAVGATNLHHTE